MTSELFLRIGNNYTNASFSYKSNLRRFKSFFGVNPDICLIIWDMIKSEAPLHSKPKHLLWCLNFLKQYSTEHERRSIFKADEKTIRKWTWIFVELLSNLSVVCIL